MCFPLVFMNKPVRQSPLMSLFIWTRESGMHIMDFVLVLRHAKLNHATTTPAATAEAPPAIAIVVAVWRATLPIPYDVSRIYYSLSLAICCVHYIKCENKNQNNIPHFMWVCFFCCCSLLMAFCVCVLCKTKTHSFYRSMAAVQQTLQKRCTMIRMNLYIYNSECNIHIFFGLVLSCSMLVLLLLGYSVVYSLPLSTEIVLASRSFAYTCPFYSIRLFFHPFWSLR